MGSSPVRSTFFPIVKTNFNDLSKSPIKTENMNQKFAKLTERLLDIPTEIHEIQLGILTNLNAGKETRDEITKVEAAIKNEVLNALDSIGKRLYPNADAREFAFIDASQTNEELIRLKTEYDSLQEYIKRKQIDLELLNNEQLNARVLLSFFASNSTLID